ncbi:hypothetical protein ACFTUC_15640 [Streptomyces sp. NPDC056944]|uniref:hypothetical protein n=1 Tax=Streptomyces sp. NPDC056944 TaxID=3345972 RepID=UPI003625F60A
MRHPRLNSDAKLLLIYVQGLPETASAKPLGEHATDLGMRPRAYHRAKECLVACGFLHEWKFQSGRGYWMTTQLLSNVTLTSEEAVAARDGIPPESRDVGGPTAGNREPRRTGTQLPVEEDRGSKTSPHPPTEEPAPKPEADELAPEADREAAPEVVRAESVLLSLWHRNRDLRLGEEEARGLAEVAAEWLRRGVSAADLRHALTAHLPRDGVRSAVGFLRHRLKVKLPAPLLPPEPEESPAETARHGLVACEGPGAEHVFRPVGDETQCGGCRRELARQAAGFRPKEPTERPSWRTRVEEVLAEGAAPAG